MLIVDLNTLQTIYTLNLTDHVILNRLDTLDLQDIMRIYGTLCQLVSGLDLLSLRHLDT